MLLEQSATFAIHTGDRYKMMKNSDTQQKQGYHSQPLQLGRLEDMEFNLNQFDAVIEGKVGMELKQQIPQIWNGGR